MREARPNDLGKVLEVELQSFPPGEAYPSWVFEWILSSNPDLFIVLDCSGEVKGYAMSLTEGNTCHIVSIAVAPDSRGKGFGKLLLRSLEERCKKRGLSMVKLEVKISNHIALNMYRSEGYKIQGYIKNYYPDGSDAYFMVKNL